MYNKVLIDIEDRVQAICDKMLNKLSTNGPQRNDDVNSDISRETKFNIIELQDQLNQMLPNLLS